MENLNRKIREKIFQKYMLIEILALKVVQNLSGSRFESSNSLQRKDSTGAVKIVQSSNFVINRHH